MSLAWGSLVLLILLLPGVLFFVGLYLPEQFTRETTERSALGQLAATLLVAFVVHGVLYCLLSLGCGARLPCVSIPAVLETIVLERGPSASPRAVGAMLHQHRWWILLYTLSTAALGVLAGYATGKLAIAGPLRGLTQHGWVYDLSIGDNLTVAYVLTHIRHDDRVLMYQGFLKGFGLQQDGRFSYIILSDAMRGYMHLAGSHPETSAPAAWKRIGTSEVVVPPRSNLARGFSRRERSYFVIEGEDIANAVFDRLAFDFGAALKDVDVRLRRVQEEFRRTRAARAPAPAEAPLPPAAEG